PNAHWLGPGLLLLSLVWVAGLAAAIPWTPVTVMSEWTLSLPTGWVNGAIRHTFFEPHPLAIGYLVAIAATWIYAANWLPRGFCIREVLIGASGKLPPVFASGLPTPPEALVALPASAAPSQTDSGAAQPDKIRQAPTSQSIQEKLRSLLGNSWNGCGLLE